MVPHIGNRQCLQLKIRTKNVQNQTKIGPNFSEKSDQNRTYWDLFRDQFNINQTKIRTFAMNILGPLLLGLSARCLGAFKDLLTVITIKNQTFYRICHHV